VVGPAIIISDRWKKQPKGLLRVATNSELTRDLKFFQTGAAVEPFTNNGTTIRSIPLGVTRYYTSASSQYLKASSMGMTTYPLTFAAIALRATSDVENTLVCLGNTPANIHHSLSVNSSNAVTMRSYASAAESASVAGTVATNQQFLAAGVVRNATYRQAFLNGVAATANTDSRVTAGMDTVAIGAKWANGAAAEYFNGYVQLALIWNRELAEGEILEWMKAPWQVFNKDIKISFFIPPLTTKHMITRAT
jgi:hypothetical protein